MSHICVRLQMKLLSDTIFSSGNSIPGGEDIALRVDSSGIPFLPGSTFKGLLRESLGNYLCWKGCDCAEEELNALMGQEGLQAAESERRLVFSDFHMDGCAPGASDWAGLRTFTRLENGVVATGTLRTAACLRRGLTFSGLVFCREEDYPSVRDSARAIQWVGLLRNRGFGHVLITAEKEPGLRRLNSVGETVWLRYRLRAETPVAISWLSQSGLPGERNDTESRNFIPGSAIRGMVLSALAQEEPQWFAENRVALLRQVSFCNALPLGNPEASQPLRLIPTPKGFYESRERGEIYSVLNRDVEAGDKRAPLGSFCHIEKGVMRPFSPAMETSLRMKRDVQDKQVFTIRAIAAGTELEGYIRVENPALMPKICAAFREWVWLGAKKFAGNGLCKVVSLEASEPAYEFCGYGPKDAVPARLYMLLMSPAAMLHKGEAGSLDLNQLAEALGVNQVTIPRCATSSIEAGGFNRTWGCYGPTVSMYDMGSVFCLECDRPPTLENLHKMEQLGIGIRREEGYGRVLFLKDFERLGAYAKPEDAAFRVSEAALQRQARCRWLLKTPLPEGLSGSQLGNVQAICEGILAGTKRSADLEEFFRHNMNNRGARMERKYRKLKDAMDLILGQPLSVTLDCPGYKDSPDARIRLICDWIDLSRKGGRGA